MKRKLFSALILAAMLLTACTSGQDPTASEPTSQTADRLSVVTTTYPIYVFACAVTDGVDGVTVERLNTGEASCLHDYTLSVDDMKKIEGADVLAMNGVELEEFMDDALARVSSAVIDCSQNIELLASLECDQDHDEPAELSDQDDFDPHVWMDPKNAEIMVQNLADGLERADPAHADAYRQSAQLVKEQLNELDAQMQTLRSQSRNIAGMITFHDGFQYFAKAYDLPLLASIEEEAGSEASAKEVNHIVQLVKDNRIPVIFTEVNGSDATAQSIARETGCRVSQLSMCMDGPDGALSNYLDCMTQNLTAVLNGFAGEESTL